MNTKPVTHNGVYYPSQAALSRAYGLCTETARQAIAKGRLHTLGAGGGAGAVEAMAEARRQPVAACGLSWPSQKACAADLSVGRNAVWYNLTRGTFEAWVAKRLRVLGRTAITKEQTP
jgi:hypothetical protein